VHINENKKPPTILLVAFLLPILYKGFHLRLVTGYKSRLRNFCCPFIVKAFVAAFPSSLLIIVATQNH